MLVLNAQKEALLKPLQTVTSVVERKHTLPILSNVLIVGESERAAFIATDLELQITTWLNTGVENDCAFTVSARKFLDICRSLPEETRIELDLHANQQLKIKAGKSRFSLLTLPAEDFPLLQMGEGEGIDMTLAQGKLRHLLGRAQYAMAVQDIRYYLNGMLLSFQGDRLTVVATDGHRLAMDAMDLEAPVTAPIDIILPRKTVLELIKLLGEDDTALDIQINVNQVVFKHPDFELRSKVVDGKFPDYQRVVPSGYEKQFVIGRQRFQQALLRTAILTNEKYRGVRLAMTANSLRIACNNNEQEEAQEELEIAYDFDPLDIGFNVQYLQDVLGNLDAEAVQCSFGDASSSLLITIPGEEHFRYVVMPMRI